MSKLLLLYRTLRKCDASTSAAAPAAPAADEHSLPVSMIVYPVLAIVAMGGIGFAGYQLAPLFELFGGIGVVLSVLCLILGVVLFAKGLIQLVNILYMSTDTSLLIAMPVSPLTLAAVRLARPLGSSLLIMAGVLVSFAAGYALAVPAGPAFFVGVLLYVVLVPLFTTLLAAAAAIAFMSVFRVFRSRNAMKYLGVAGAVIGVIAYVAYEGVMNADIDAGKAVGAVVGVTKGFTPVVPVIPFIQRFMTTGEILPILGALLVTAAALCLFLAAAKALYLKGAIAMQDAAASGRRMKEKALAKLYAGCSPRRAYMRREIRGLLRNPVYMLRNFIIAFLWPLILVPLVLLSMPKDAPSQEAIAQELAAAEFAPSTVTVLLLTLGAVAAGVIFLNMINELAYSAVTREGETFAALKQLPFSFSEQIRAKRDVALAIVGTTSVGYMAVAALVGICVGVVPWYALPYGLLIGVPLVLLAVDIDMILGIRGANLHWENEASAVRKNAKMILGSYLLAVLIIVALAMFGVFLMDHDFPAIPCLLAVPLPLIAGDALADRHMYKLAEERLAKL